jgi:hypothetical protein
MGVYNQDHRVRYQDISGRTTVATGDNLSATPRSLVALKAGFTIYVQKIEIAVITDNAATLTLQDTNSSVRKIATTKASPGLGPILFDYGDEGVALTEGKGLDLINSAAGLAAEVVWTGYRKPTATLTTAQV